MTPHIVVVGSLNMDLVIRAQRHPSPGETITGEAFRTIPGGKGANQAVAAARMGGRVTMIGSVGTDPFGDALVTNLEAAGVETKTIERVENPTGVALITVSASGENTIVLAPGANGAVSPDMVAAHGSTIASADVLILQLEVPLAAVELAAKLAHEHGVQVILNPAPAQPLPAQMLACVSYLIPNEHEAALLADLPTNGPIDAALAASRLQTQSVRGVIVTLGSRGALVLTPEGFSSVPSFPVRVVDSTAAGDAFVGAFSVALSEGRTAVQAARWGCAAGALACTTLGAQPSLPWQAEVEKLLDSEPA